MAKIAKNLTELIGNTPLLEVSNYSTETGLKAKLLTKLEYFNPLSSVKDRIGYAMIKDAEDRGGPGRHILRRSPGCGNSTGSETGKCRQNHCSPSAGYRRKVSVYSAVSASIAVERNRV